MTQKRNIYLYDTMDGRYIWSKNRWTHQKDHNERLDDSNNESTLVTKIIMNDRKKRTIHEWTQFTQNGVTINDMYGQMHTLSHKLKIGSRPQILDTSHNGRWNGQEVKI